jgi:hypothetical protein
MRTTHRPGDGGAQIGDEGAQSRDGGAPTRDEDVETRYRSAFGLDEHAGPLGDLARVR